MLTAEYFFVFFQKNWKKNKNFPIVHTCTIVHKGSNISQGAYYKFFLYIQGTDRERSSLMFLYSGHGLSSLDTLPPIETRHRWSINPRSPLKSANLEKMSATVLSIERRDAAELLLDTDQGFIAIGRGTGE